MVCVYMHICVSIENYMFTLLCKVLQSEVDDLQVELRRRDASLQLLTDEKYRVLERLGQEESESHQLFLSCLNLDYFSLDLDVNSIEFTLHSLQYIIFLQIVLQTYILR